MLFEMILWSAISLITSMLIAAASILLTLRTARWFTVLMSCGAVFSLFMRTAWMTIGFLENAGKASQPTYQHYSELAYTLGPIGNLIFAIGFVATGIHLNYRLASLARRDSVPI
jgi:uncharacterized protein involved in response to NO